MVYGYDKLLGDTKTAAEKYAVIKKYKIGQSLQGREIQCLENVGGHKKILLCGAFHGLESITAAFLVRFAEGYAAAVTENKALFGRDAALLSANISLFIVPMVNPDGVEIALCGGDNKAVWQANARGVDINHNFDADWQPILDAPAPSKYGGEHPHSEKETRAVADFIRRENFDMLLCFHSQGEEIYYDFKGKCGKRSKEIAERMAEESGYTVCVPKGTAAFGGCKDWFIKEFMRDGFTIEMGRGTNPLPLEMLDDIYEPCAKIILCAMEGALR